MNIETIINRAGAQNPRKSEDLAQPVNQCCLIKVFIFTGESRGS